MTTCKLIAEMLGPLQSNEDGYTHTYVRTGYIDVRTYLTVHTCRVMKMGTLTHTYVRTGYIDVRTYVCHSTHMQSNEDGYTHTYVPTGYIDGRTYVCHSTHMHICTANTIHTYGHTYVRTVDIHVHTYVSLRSTNMTVDQSISYQNFGK